MNEPTKKRTLEDFALKSMGLAKMTGVTVATHAMPDGFILMHSGVGCKYKTSAQISLHDWGSHPNKGEAWTQVAELQLVKGSGERIAPFARAWYERRRPGFIAVSTAYFIELTGEDFSDTVAALEKEMPCDMALIPTVAPNGGFFDGYASTMYAVAERAGRRHPWTSPPKNAKEVSTVGFFFHRYEPDQQADVAQLRSLYKVAGLEAGPILFSGRKYEELTKASEAAHVVQLPYIKPVEKKFRRLLKHRNAVKLDLPMGLAGTARFVRELAASTGGDLARVEAWIEGQMKVVQPQVHKFRDRVRGATFIVCADTPLAAGLVTILTEIGVRVPLVCLRDTGGSVGGKVAFLETLGKNGVTDLEGMEILEDPSLRVIRSRWLHMAQTGQTNGFIGSAHELNLMSTVPGPFASRLASTAIETGFPCDHHHPTIAEPSLGYVGVLSWTHRVLQIVKHEAAAEYAPGF